jgi:hypothetical protein
MKNSQARPRRENGRKVTVLQNRDVSVTQIRLAHIQQLQSDIAELNRRLTKDWDKLRREILGGAYVEPGPMRAFIRRSGQRKILIVK